MSCFASRRFRKGIWFPLWVAMPRDVVRRAVAETNLVAIILPHRMID